MTLLAQSITEWIDRLSQRRPEFGGNAPCPFSATAGFTCIACQDITAAVAVIRGTHRLAVRSVLILELPMALAAEAHLLAYGMRDELKARDMIAMVSDPSRPVVVSGLRTTQESHLLIIVQRLDEMEKASEVLRRLGYYDKWTSDAFEMVR